MMSAWKSTPGELVALVGNNGAGKSTLLHTICGIQPASGGTILFEGSNISGLSTNLRVRRGISQVPEARQVFGPMSVEDNLMMGAFTRGKRDAIKDLDEVYALFPMLAEKRRQSAGTLSGGQQQMLAIGRGLMAKPRLLLLDEPSMGLAPKVTDETFEIIRTLKHSGTTIFLVEQNASSALSIADRGYVLEDRPGRALRYRPRAARQQKGAGSLSRHVGSAPIRTETRKEHFMARKRISRFELSHRLKTIKLVSLDVDGILTDGGLYFTDDGTTLRKFNVKDGLGIKRLMAAGVTVAIISSGPQDAIRRRMESLGIQHVYTGVPNKRETLEQLCGELGIDIEDVIHMGDDLNDLPIMEIVGCPISVPDAMPEVRDHAVYVTTLKGGAGAVREICDMTLSVQHPDEDLPTR